jgi:hypothetical protein
LKVPKAMDSEIGDINKIVENIKKRQESKKCYEKEVIYV